MQIIKFPDNNMGENLSDLGFSNEFLDITPKAWFIKKKEEEKDELGFIKIKNFCSSQDSAKRTERQATNWEAIFAKHISDEGPASPKSTKNY